MSKRDKLLERLKGRPKDFSYDELRTLLLALGCDEDQKGKTAGSSLAFVHRNTKLTIMLHKPHPGNELKMYQVKQVLGFLTDLGVIQ